MNQTIISDMNNYKQKEILQGENKYERFQSYMHIRFGDMFKVRQFYDNYPYAMRILITRTKYLKKNIKLLIERLNEEFLEFKNGLFIKGNTISSIEMSMGDTHNKGESVSIINFAGDQKVVYKPKNLKVVEEIDKFMEFSNENLQSSFYITKKMVTEKYTFEEFISQRDVSNLKDIATFYENYGELLGLAYILNGSDFHFENIIANKEYPVIIDMETYFHQTTPLKYDEDVKSIIREKLSESVIASSMLPFEIMKERSNDKVRGIDLSGLSFGRHKFPFNILILKDAGTDEMRFEWDEAYMNECNNVPTYREKNALC